MAICSSNSHESRRVQAIRYYVHCSCSRKVTQKHNYCTTHTPEAAAAGAAGHKQKSTSRHTTAAESETHPTVSLHLVILRRKKEEREDGLWAVRGRPDETSPFHFLFLSLSLSHCDFPMSGQNFPLTTTRARRRPPSPLSSRSSDVDISPSPICPSEGGVTECVRACF